MRDAVIDRIGQSYGANPFGAAASRRGEGIGPSSAQPVGALAPALLEPSPRQGSPGFLAQLLAQEGEAALAPVPPSARDAAERYAAVTRRELRLGSILV
jgi:hypothetical protein